MEMNTNLRTTEINLFEKKSEMGRSQTMNKRTKKKHADHCLKNAYKMNNLCYKH